MQQAVRSGRFELKKIKGDENPADLLTKHNQTHERIEKLVGLYDCYFKGGRADAAPSLRRSQSDKKTLAKAEQESRKPLLASVAPSGEPYMPHNCLGPAELERRFPSLEAVPDVPLHDLTRLEDDTLYAAGMGIVQEILEEMAATGRTKRPQQCLAGPVLSGPSPEPINYTGLNTLLAAEECGNLIGCASWQQAGWSRLSLSAHSLQFFFGVFQSEPHEPCLTRAARTPSNLCFHCDHSQC